MNCDGNKEYNIRSRAVLKDYIPYQLLKDVDETKSLELEGKELLSFYMNNSKGKLRIYENAEQLEKNLKIYGEFPLNWKKYPVEMVHMDFPFPDDYFNLKGEKMNCKQDCLLHLHYQIHRRYKFKTPMKLLEKMKKQMKRIDGSFEFVKCFDEYQERIMEDLPIPLPSSEDIKLDENEDMDKIETILEEFDCILCLNRYLTNPDDVIAVVRIFEDTEDQRFVMKSELFNAINLKHPNQTPLICEDKEGFLETIQLNEVYRTYRDQISGINFIRLPVKRAKHAAVPIPTPSGDHCILASDALLEILRRLISAMNIFQKIKPNDVHLVFWYFEILDRYFPRNTESVYFINLELVKKLQLETDEYWKQFDEIPVISVRNVGPKGFGRNEFKKELKKLGLDVIFPRITMDLNMIPCAKSSCFNTTEMIKFVEIYQLKCFLNKFSSLKQFLHTQNACRGHLFLTCDYCDHDKSLDFYDEEEEEVSTEKVMNKTENKELATVEAVLVGEKMNLPESRQTLIDWIEQWKKDPDEKDKMMINLAEAFISLNDKYHEFLEVIKKKEETRQKEDKENNDKSKILVDETNEKLKKRDAKISFLEQKNLDLLNKQKKERFNLLEKHHQETTSLEKEIDVLKRLQETKKCAEIDRNRMEENLRQATFEYDTLQKSTDQQFEEQTRVNQELHETISILSNQYEDQLKIVENQGNIVKRLLARISTISDPKHSEEGPCPFRKQLMGLRKMKDNLEVRSPLKLAKDISQRLISLSTRPEIQEMATHEYQQFEGKHQILLQEVIGNIQKLKDYGDVMAFPPLPEYPSFSDQFVNEYWNEIEKQKASTSSESADSGELLDSECLICFVEMKPDEQTLKCDHCRKILHLECASKWLKIHRSCPHCRREQLDPNEFPALG